MFEWLRDKLGLSTDMEFNTAWRSSLLHAIDACAIDTAANLKLLTDLHSRMDRLETKLGIQTGISLGRDPLSADARSESDRIAKTALRNMRLKS